MVEVGDTVFVVPLYGEKDNLAIIHKIREEEEEDYNAWTKVWLEPIPDGLRRFNIDWLVDEVREVISIAWTDSPSRNERYGVFNLSDFSQVFLSSIGSDYRPGYPDLTNKLGIYYGGCVDLHGPTSGVSSFSRSRFSHILLLRADVKTLEVWQGGATPLWTHDLDTDFSPVGDGQYVAGISSTGKYVTVLCINTGDIALYSGS